jgi:thiol-disulfide isomerase/thioredoxin
MKNILTLSLLLTGLAAFSQKAIKTDSVYISGKIENYAKYKDSANSVRFIINDIVLGDQTNHQAKVKNDGTYSIAIAKIGMQDIYIEYNENLDDILVSPGDHLTVNFDANDLDHTQSFSGDGAQANQDYKAYGVEFKKACVQWYGTEDMSRFRAMAASQKDDNPDTYKKLIAKWYAQEQTFLNNYLKARKLSPTFAKWVTTNQKTEYYENLMRYAWLHPMYAKLKPEDFKLSDNYYDFMTEVPINDPGLAISSHYGYYLGEYGRYIAKKAFPDKMFVKDVIPMLFKLPSSFAKDVMICQEFYGPIKSTNMALITPFMADFKKNVSNPAFSNKIIKAYDDAVYQQNNFTLPANAQINQVPKTEADSLFNKLVGKYANKVVYIDFWATWCGPCRDEMPNSKLLRDKLAGKGVVFLYLGLQSEEKAWKATIAKLDIQGEHYLLNKNEYAAIAEKFQISGIPHYVLVDQKGRVVDGNAKRPGDDKLKPEIEALLAKGR